MPFNDIFEDFENDDDLRTRDDIFIALSLIIDIILDSYKIFGKHIRIRQGSIDRRRYELSMFKLSISSSYLIQIYGTRIIAWKSWSEEFLHFSHLEQKPVLLLDSHSRNGYDSSWWRRRERRVNIYIYIYFDTMRLCRIKLVGRYTHSESIHAVTWNVMNPDIRWLCVIRQHNND